MGAADTKRLRGLVAKVPPFSRPPVQRSLIANVRRVRWTRAQTFERLGSDRYSATAVAGMDRYLADLLGPNGYFIEAGANDGFRQSNTYLLERFHGWTGLLVEPIPALYQTCSSRRDARVVNCALVADCDVGTVTMSYADLNSAVEAERETTNWGWDETYKVEVPARTLTEVLEEAEAPRPDLLSLDVEGHEEQALAGLDLSRYGPRFILMEVWGGDISRFGPDFQDRYEVAHWFSDKDVLLAANSQD